jgi:cytochrome c-type biogenesis protein CcmH/NrfG
VVLAFIVVLTWIAYWPCLWGGFIWDDNPYVLYNPLLHDAAGLWRIWAEPTATPQYHPLVFTSFWIEYQLWGTSTFGYHAVNVALHTANTLLFWALLRRLQVPGAALAAGVFALHPVHVESVAWITERKDVLATFFYGLAMLAWLDLLDSGRQRSWLLSVLFGAGALLSKAILCTLPAAMALLAWWRVPKQWRRWSPRLLPLLVGSAAIAAVSVWREHAHGNPDLPYSLLDRLLIASRALWVQVAALVWPVDLTIAYDRWQVSAQDPFAYAFVLAWIAVAAVLILVRPRYGDGPIVAVAFYVGTLSPMLGFVDFNIMRFAFVADHFQYVAGAGLIALAASAAVRWTRAWPAAAGLAAAAVLLSILGFGSWRQAALYVDADTMWHDNLAKNPRSWSAWNYFVKAEMRENDLDAAVVLLQRAAEAMPEHAEPQRTLGVVFATLGRRDEAVEHLDAAVKLDPESPLAASNLGAVLVSMGRVDEAVPHLDRAVRLAPGDAEAWRYRAFAAAQLGRREQAISDLQRVLQLKPDDARARAVLDGLLATP